MRFIEQQSKIRLFTIEVLLAPTEEIGKFSRMHFNQSMFMEKNE